MPTVIDLGQKVKQKYPGSYDDLSDLELGQRTKTKYPGSYDDFTDIESKVDVVAPKKKGLLDSVSSFLFEKPADIIAKSFGAKELQKTSEQTVLNETKSIDQLIKKAKTFEVGSPQRKELLQRANQIAQQSSSQAGEVLSEIPTRKQAIGAATDVGLSLAPTLGLSKSIGKTLIGSGAIGAGFGAAQSLEDDNDLNETLKMAGIQGVANATIFGGLKGLGKSISKLSQKIPERLIKSSFGITKSQVLRNPTLARDILGAGKQIIGTPEVVAKRASQKLNVLEGNLDDILKSIDIDTPTREIVSKVKSLGKEITSAPGERDARVILDSIVSDIRKEGSKLSQLKKNEIKRKLYGVLNSAYGQESTVKKELQKMTARVFKESIEEVAPKNAQGQSVVKEINKQLGLQGTIKKLATRKAAEGGKNVLGLGDLVLGGSAAGGAFATNQDPLESVGTGLGLVLLRKGLGSSSVKNAQAIGIDKLVKSLSGRSAEEIRKVLLSALKVTGNKLNQ